MHIEEYRSYCLSKKGVTESFPFSKLPNVLVFKVLEKMFTATDVSSFDSLSVKTNPTKIEELRAEYSCLSIQPYMNKNHWNKVILDNSVADTIIYSWINTSYTLVVNGMTNKLKQQLKTLS